MTRYDPGRRPPARSTAARPAYRPAAGRMSPVGRRRWPRRALIAANILVAVCIIGTASAYGYVQWRLDQIHKEQISSLTSINGGKPFTLLVVGSDSRSALANTADNAQFGGAAATSGQRSDTIILIRIAPATRQAEILSIPRDLWVDIPGMGQSRINAAFDSGANLLVKTIQQDLGIPINHFAEVNFDTFRAISDAVGGVKFYFPTPAKDAYSLLNVPAAGCVTLTGDQALAFVRSRHYEYYENGSWHFEAQSDLARIRRQQAFIKKMLKKAQSEFTNPIALNNVIAGVTKNLTVDSGFSSSLLINLARDFHGVDPASILTVTLPNYPYTTAGGADVLGLQQPQAAQTIAAFNKFGDTPPASAGKSSTKKASTPKVTAPAVTVAPSSVAVEVVNGDGVAGQAAKMTSFLSGRGYKATTSFNSPGTGFATTQVLYSPDAKTAAEQIAAAIPGGATIAVSSALVPTAYNVEVVTGSSYTAASGATAIPSSTSATPPTTTTTVPGTNPLSYSLPGLAPGQTVPADC